MLLISEILILCSVSLLWFIFVLGSMVECSQATYNSRGEFMCMYSLFIPTIVGLFGWASSTERPGIQIICFTLCILTVMVVSKIASVHFKVCSEEKVNRFLRRITG